MTDDDTTALLGKNDIIDRLCDTDEEKRIVLTPLLSSKQLQAASVDIRLGADFAVIKTGKLTHLDPLKEPKVVEREVKKYTERYKMLTKHERFIIHPGEFVLGNTLEYIKLPTDIAGRLEGRSSWGRLGILIHITAGYIDPGFCGNITFELKNTGKIPIPLYPGIRIGQLSFFNVSNSVGYEGNYQESFGTVTSKYFNDEEYKIIRKLYGDKYYSKLITEVFEAVDNNKALPKSINENIPQEIIRIIAEEYKRTLGEE